MAEPFLGEIKMISGNTIPQNWALCNGQLLSISQNTALFSLLGTTYGGDGRQTFALPDLRSRVPMHFDTNMPYGTQGGAESVVLTESTMPTHSHTIMASSAAANTVSPAGSLLAAPPRRTLYDSTADTLMESGSVSSAGAGQGHENRQPFLTLNFIIALLGIFPPRN